MDINYFEQLWGKNETDKTMSRDFWNGRAEEFNEKKQNNENDAMFNKLFELFLTRGMLKDDGCVLDIGCGPGKYSTAFAPKVKSVYGIDISPNMIEYAKTNAIEAGVDNAFFDVLDWEMADLEKLGWERNFDLVFASMCPGINNKNALQKMIDASKGGCFLSTFIERKDSVRDYLNNLVNGDSAKKSYGKAIYCGFNILWLMGYYPEIIHMDNVWENNYTIEKAISLYTAYLNMKRPIDNEQKKQVADYLEGIAQDGVIKEEIKSKVAWMYWTV